MHRSPDIDYWIQRLELEQGPDLMRFIMSLQLTPEMKSLVYRLQLDVLTLGTLCSPFVPEASYTRVLNIHTGNHWAWGGQLKRGSDNRLMLTVAARLREGMVSLRVTCLGQTLAHALPFAADQYLGVTAAHPDQRAWSRTRLLEAIVDQAQISLIAADLDLPTLHELMAE